MNDDESIDASARNDAIRLSNQPGSSMPPRSSQEEWKGGGKRERNSLEFDLSLGREEAEKGRGGERGRVRKSVRV